jgi:hypothetical protein
VACSARNATGRSACSAMTRFSCARQSATCSAIRREQQTKEGSSH